jgi:hypothetical protein
VTATTQRRDGYATLMQKKENAEVEGSTSAFFIGPHVQ